MFVKERVLKNFVKFTEKHLFQSLSFNKVAGLRPVTLLKKRLWHRCFPVNFAKFSRTARVAACVSQIRLRFAVLPRNRSSQVTIQNCFQCRGISSENQADSFLQWVPPFSEGTSSPFWVPPLSDANLKSYPLILRAIQIGACKLQETP